MDGWDYAFMAIAGFVAVTSLVALMRKQRDRLLDQIQQHLSAAAKRKRARQADEPTPKNSAA